MTSSQPSAPHITSAPCRIPTSATKQKKNCRFLDAVAQQPLDRPPVWMMRQAGRYLPEYRKLRTRVSFQDAIRQPEVAAEITLQPLQRFPLDAAILFADIMTPLESMGPEITFAPGPRLTTPVQNVQELRPFVPHTGTPFVLETLSLVRHALPHEVALIGFCGAPFTLAAYLIEGNSSRDFLSIRSMSAKAPEQLKELLSFLADAMADYLAAQFEAGADAVQIFDSWAGLQSAPTFRQFGLPAVQRLLSRLHNLHNVTGPVTYFAPDAAHLLDDIATLNVTMVGVDWRFPIDKAWECLPGKAIQGNLDPAVLLAGPEATRASTTDILRRVNGRPGHVFNLGHGIAPTTPLDGVTALLETVTSWNSNL